MIDGLVLVADDLAGHDDRLEQVAGAEPAGDAGQVGAGAAALVVEAVAGEARAPRRRACGRGRSRARFRPDSTIGTSSSSVQSLTNGRRARRRPSGRRSPGVASRIGFSSAFSDSLRVATASSLMLLHEPAEAVAALEAGGLEEPGEVRLAELGGPAGLEHAERPGVVDLLLLGRGRLQQGDRLGRGVGGLEVDEQLAQLDVQLAALGRVERVEPGDRALARSSSSGLPKRMKTTSIDAEQVELAGVGRARPSRAGRARRGSGLRAPGRARRRPARGGPGPWR